MANDTIMMNMDDVEKLMEKINQSIAQFIEVRETLNHGAENFETTLKMLSQNAFQRVLSSMFFKPVLKSPWNTE